MLLWYAALYVVIEGWKELDLSDSEVDGFLSDDRTDKLRVFRNKVFHYQKEYSPNGLVAFLEADGPDGSSSAEWVRGTHFALGRAIVRSIEETNPTYPEPRA
ncbi:hypothetical protein A0130_03200 [Leifsonia xyli]|nr:hypothetical protein A0130_03200 [Leifsonia xyli]